MTATIRSFQLSDPWVQALIHLCQGLDVSAVSETTIDPIWIKECSKQALVAKGYIPFHTDNDCDPWAYLLILQADNAVLDVVGQPRVQLAPGMIVEFNAHRQHRLIQPPGQLTLWLPLDSTERLSLDKAAHGFRMAWDVLK